MTRPIRRRKIKRKLSLHAQVQQLQEDVRWLSAELIDSLCTFATQNFVESLDAHHREQYNFLLEENRRIAQSMCKLALSIDPLNEEHKEAMKKNESRTQ